MMTTATKTKTGPVRIATRARCRVCGQPVTAASKAEA